MKITHCNFGEVSPFSPTDIAIATQDDRLQQFIKYSPSIESFRQVIEDKKKDKTDREVLVKVLREQYSRYVTNTEKGESLIDLLADPRTFTVTTAHQPVLFTGPLYVIYKIISAVKMTRNLQSVYSDYNFVPVFISGGEDHDFEEMNHMNLFGKDIIWNNDENGSVARMSTKSLGPALEELKEILGTSPSAERIYELFHQTHTSHEVYGTAFCDLINGIFSDIGIIVLNMDHPALKRKMIPIFRDELIDHHSMNLVRDTQDKIEQAGFKPQAYAREINLFLLDEGRRDRIELVDGKYTIVDTDVSYSQDEMLDLLEQSPERFSPNVVMRPLYQETILPNLAYIGGGGELAYWIERKSQFAHFDLNFPMLIRRDSCLWVEGSVTKRIHKLGLELSDFFKEETVLIKEYVTAAAENEFKLGKEKGQLMQIFKGIEEKAKAIDPTLRSAIAAEAKNQLKSLEKIEDRMRRTEKQKHDIAIGQIKTVLDKLFPQGSMQERKINFLNFYFRDPDNYLSNLMEAFDPLDARLKIIEV